MATKAKSAVEQLHALEEEVLVAERRKQEVEAGRRRASRALAQAEGRRLDLERARGAGEDIGDDEIAEAVAAIQEAKAEADARVWSARLDGAAEAIEQAERERDQFGISNFALIAAEEAAKDGPARDALQEAWDVLQAAANAYAVRVRVWHQLAPYGHFPTATIPTGRPLAGTTEEVVRRFEEGLPVPTPPQLRR